MDCDIVVVGSINADLVLRVPRHPDPGETILGRGSVTLPGGKGANQAVAAARLGATVAMVGAVGTDPHAEVALQGLREAGVALDQVRTVEGPTGLAVVTLADDSENSIIVIPGANEAVTPSLVEAADQLLAAARICVLQAEIPMGSVIRAAEVAHGHATRVLLNVAPAAALPRATLQLADPLVVNEHEAGILLGHALRRTEDPAAELAALGVRSVVITWGAAGVTGHEDGASWSVPARRVEALDTTGAGDAFVGALAAELAAGSSSQRAAVLATRVAAASVLRLGAQTSYPWKGDPLP
ncbi:ribokinase [Cellulomonas hominis]